MLRDMLCVAIDWLLYTVRFGYQWARIAAENVRRAITHTAGFALALFIGARMVGVWIGSEIMDRIDGLRQMGVDTQSGLEDAASGWGSLLAEMSDVAEFVNFGFPIEESGNLLIFVMQLFLVVVVAKVAMGLFRTIGSIT